jgi:peptide/nickel transport system substrate-binding protein
MAAVAGLAASLAAAGCSAPATGGHGGGSGGTLTVGLAEAPDALDPTTSATFVSRIVYANMCEKLYDVNAKLQLIPQLAASMPTVSPDGRTYTIRLRPGIRFNDGTPLTAAAVKTTLDWYRTDPLSARASELSPVTAVNVTGPLTVQLKLSAPFAPLTSILADRSGMILSPAQLHKLGKNFARDPVCVGPFAFASRPSTDTINLVKSKYYYGRASVHLSKLVFQVITDDSARAADLQSGDIQVADRIAPQDVTAVEHNPATRIIGQNSLGYQGLDINVGNVHGALKQPGTAANPFATHPQLREAFDLSLNRADINKAAFDGQYTPGCTPIPPNSPWAVHVPCPQQNIAKARQLVAASGVKTPIHVSLMVENAPLQIQIGTIIQSMAKQAGFDVSLQPTEFTTALSRAMAGQYEMFQIGWSGRLDPDQNIYAFVTPHSALNYTGADYPALTRLLNQARTTTPAAARRALYTKIVRMIQQERNIIYLWYDKLELGLRTNVKGVAFYSDGLIRLRNAQVTSG